MGAFAGSANAVDKAAVDGVFAAYDSTQNPGCALGVYQQGEVTYARGYGMANLEYNIAITPDSVFRIASDSKQFVAFAIAMLDEAGELSLDDPVQKYFPEMPDYGEPVTLRHMIHHTSGIRDYLELAWLADWGEAYSTAEAVTLIEQQRALNFPPGTDYLYSNSGYLLLGEVVRQVSGQSLKDWSEDNLFKPLAMNNTHFHDDHTHLVPGRATGYERAEDGTWHINMTQLDMVGDGGILTTVMELLQWNNNFYANALGKGEQSLIEQLETPAVLNNGESIDYAFGLTIGEFLGAREVSHGGSWVGYRSGFNRYPEHQLGIAVLCNDAATDPTGLAREVAKVYLAATAAGRGGVGVGGPAPVTGGPGPVPTLVLDEDTLSQYTGTYWNGENLMERRIVLEGGQLYYDRGWGRSALEALAGDPHRFQMAPGAQPLQVVFTDPGSAEPGMTVRGGSDEPTVFQKLAPPVMDEEALSGYVGEYVSEELGHRQKIVLKDGTLHALRREGPVKLDALFEDSFSTGEAILQFQRDTNGRVSGFLLGSGRVRNLAYAKLGDGR